MKHIPLFVINLDGSRDRLTTMTERLGKIGLSFERIPAIAGRSLTYEQRSLLYPPMKRERELGDSEIGCYASHLKALQIVVDRKLARAIILEDDAQFGPDFAPWASAQLKFPDNTDILKLERMHTRSTKAIRMQDFAGRSIYFSAKPSFGCACYLVTLTGATKILERCSVIKTACDHQFFQYWNNGIFTYEVIPAPVHQDDTPSTLDDDREPFDQARKQTKKLLSYKIRNWMPKNLTRFARISFQVRHFGRKTLRREVIV